MRATFVHPTAEVHQQAHLGEGTTVWNFAQIREGAHIGRECMIGRGVYIGPGVIMGNRCKIQNGAQLYQPAVLGDGVFIGPRVILTNDRHPRAIKSDGELVGPGDWDPEGVCIDDGASIGAGAIVLGGVTIGKWAMIGAGAVVTKSIPERRLAIGVPAICTYWACECGMVANQLGPCRICRRRMEAAKT